MPAQSSKPEASSPGQDSMNNEVSARRLKKREIDRKCQRQARERTRSRIAYLESLVENLQQPDGDERSSALMKRLTEVEKERDILSHTLKGVQKAVFGLENTDKQIKSDIGDIDLKTVDFGPSSLVRHNSLTDPGSPTSPTLLDGEVPNFEGRRLSQQTSRHLSLSAQSDGTSNKVADVPTKVQNDACDCCREVTGNRSSSQSVWRFANTTLMDNYKRLSPILPEEDALDEDIPVRVVLSSWSQVASQMELPASWKIMRRIDEQMFDKAGAKERLATMVMLHTMLQYHRDPTAERRSRLPAWYLQRPSQTKPHAYAINYFVWPGVRERFVFEQHKYCSNLFAKLFQTCLSILWPYDFRDCYMQNWETGAFELSSNFRTTINDISKWTMRPEFFRPFPDLRCDIPSSWNTPVPMPMTLQLQLAGGHTSAPRNPTPTTKPTPMQHQRQLQEHNDKLVQMNNSEATDAPPMTMSEPWLSQTALVGWGDTSGFSQGYMDHTLQPQWA